VVTGTSRQNALIDTDLVSLLQPFPGWQTEWIHLGPAPASYQGVRVSFGTGTFTALHTSSAGILRGVTSDDSVALLTSAPASAFPRNCSHSIGGDRCLVLGPAANLDLYLPQGCHVLMVALPATATGNGSALAAGQPRLCELDKAQINLLTRCMDSLEEIRTEPPSSPATRAAQRRLRDLLSPAATLLHDTAPRPFPQRAHLQRHLAVIRACEFVDSNLRAPIALMDLCEAAGVSTRALEYGFRDFYGLGPMAYVRNLRLCRVRHDLLDPAHADSVSSAARRWSFTHMGQFSHDYRALFGEVPSKTLAGHQRAAKATGPAS
jgi:AraC-like DNA-binding protein